MPSFEPTPDIFPGLAGTTVAVTGGASGIGRGTAFLAARCGARVLAGDLNDDALAELERDASAAGLPITPMHLDVTDPASVATFVARADVDAPLHGVVCAAGIAPYKLALDIELELWNRVLAINLTGGFLVAQEAARRMIAHDAGGSIVNISSAAGTFGPPLRAHYSASKAGMVAYSKSMARELGKDGIRLNCISPGAIDTPLLRSLMTSEQVDTVIQDFPIPRLGTPDDIACCAGYLLSDLSVWVTGQNIHITGGQHMI